jgi:hypothetical protein
VGFAFRGNGLTRCLIEEQRTIELRQAIKRARGGDGACLRNPGTLVGIENQQWQRRWRAW